MIQLLPNHLRRFRPLLSGGFLVLVAGAVGMQPVIAHEDHEQPGPQPFGEAEQHRPTPLPDRLILTLGGDPATTIDISWRTSTAAAKAVVEYVLADEFRGSSSSGGTRKRLVLEGESESFKSDLGECRQHTARISGLKPATMYAYRVGDGTHWSEWHQFRTASREPEPFTFVYFGDAQNAVRSLWSRVIREANQHAPRAAFMLHAGDLIDRANRDAEWGEWFGAGGWLNGMIPTIATPGNHEYSSLLSKHWRTQFSFPLNGPKGLEETTYWLDYQGARIVSLNSNEKVEEQVEWLRKVLTDPARPKWTIATFHHPIFSAAKSRDNPKLRDAWRPLLEQHGVDLVLQGHDHAYNRSNLGGPDNVNVPEGVTRKNSNTVYVVSVSGPKMYPLQEEWKVPRVGSGVQLFQVIKVSPAAIRYEARTATGHLYDAFVLEKDAGGRSKLTNRIPDHPPARE